MNRENASATPQLGPIVFDIGEPGFEDLIVKEPARLSLLIPPECSCNYQIIRQQIQIPIPKAKVICASNDPSPGTTKKPADGETKAAAGTKKRSGYSNCFSRRKPLLRLLQHRGHSEQRPDLVRAIHQQWSPLATRPSLFAPEI